MGQWAPFIPRRVRQVIVSERSGFELEMFQAIRFGETRRSTDGFLVGQIEHGRRIAVFSLAGEPLFWLAGWTDQPHVPDLEHALNVEVERRLQLGDWQKRKAYSLDGGSR